jgi:hypothetical protein
MSHLNTPKKELIMDTQAPPVYTLADVLAAIQNAELSATKRRDLVSAVKRLSGMLGLRPASVLDIAEVRAKLQSVLPAAHNISPKTFGKIRALFTSALAFAGVAEPLGRARAKRDSNWAALVKGIEDNKRMANGLAAFANWCAMRGIPPGEVDDIAVQNFYYWLETQTLHPKPRDVARRVPNIWNEARRKIDGWPRQELARISFKTPSQNLAWGAFRESFRADTEAYLKMRLKPDLFETDPNYPRRPLAASTVGRHREYIRLAASVLVRLGLPIERLALLADLVAPDAFRAVLRHYHNQANGNPNSFAVTLAQALIDVAQYQVKAPEPRIKELKAIAAKLPAVPFDLTEKNKELLRRLEPDATRARLLFMPDELQRRAVVALRQGRVSFVEAQVAVAVDILLIAPLRPQNLIALNGSATLRRRPAPPAR